MKALNVYEINVKVFTKVALPIQDSQSVTAELIDQSLCQDPAMQYFHEGAVFKGYVFDMLYPLAVNRIYEQNKVFSLRLRMINADMAIYFMQHLVNVENTYMKALTAEVRQMKQREMQTVYSLTPVVIRCGEKYWKGEISIEKYLELIKINLLKKYKYFTKEALDDNFELARGIEIKNKVPVTLPVKGVKMLGDKLEIHPADNAIAQNLLFMALGTGLGELNSRGAGFLNYK